MSKSKVDLAASKMSNLAASKMSNINEIQLFIDQLKKASPQQNVTNNELIHQNKRILQILKNIEAKIDKELQTHRKNMLATNPHHKAVFNKDQMKILQEKQSNNSKLLGALQKNFQAIITRRKQHDQGLQQRTTKRKHQLQDKIGEIKIELRKLKLQQKQSQKKLKAYDNPSQVDYLKAYSHLQEQLRIYSAKYVKIFSRYNKVTEQLAIASQEPQFQIPQEIYNRELQQKQEAQFKQYKSIVKLCTILSKRNDSETNKSNRIYTEKLKELEKTIIHLTELEKSIVFKQNEILEGKKNIEMIKIKMINREKVQKDLFKISIGSRNSIAEQLRHKSYSTAKLPAQNENFSNKLRNRGSSFAKLPMTIKL